MAVVAPTTAYSLRGHHRCSPQGAAPSAAMWDMGGRAPRWPQMQVARHHRGSLKDRARISPHGPNRGGVELGPLTQHPPPRGRGGADEVKDESRPTHPGPCALQPDEATPPVPGFTASTGRAAAVRRRSARGGGRRIPGAGGRRAFHRQGATSVAGDGRKGAPGCRGSGLHGRATG